jgi:hypothetical protein
LGAWSVIKNAINLCESERSKCEVHQTLSLNYLVAEKSHLQTSMNVIYHSLRHQKRSK